MTVKHSLWVEKYRPHKIADCILPQYLKDTFQGYVQKGNPPNLLLVGSPGSGKTTVAKAMLEEMGNDVYFVPSSLKRGIDNLRDDVQRFASSVSFKGKRKFVIFDEADNLTYDTQLALRNFEEQFASNCGFILTANYLNKILDALHSRNHVIEFKISSEDASNLCVEFSKRVEEILKIENIRYDRSVVLTIISDYFPDWRRCLGALQGHSSTGAITKDALKARGRGVTLDELLELMKSRNFTKVRQWAADNINSDYTKVYREFYDIASDKFKSSYVPEFVLILARYITQASMVFDQEINFCAFVTEVMVGADWK